MAQAVAHRAVTPLHRRGYLAQTALVFLAYFVAGKLGQATANIRSSNLGPVWPAFGIALAAILLLGNRAWVGVFAGAFVVAFSSPVPAVTALGQAAAATLAAFSGAFLLRRFASFDRSMSRLRDAFSLLVIGALGSAAISASIGVAVLFASHERPYSGIGSAWLVYWLGDAMGVLLVTPLVLTFPVLLRIRTRDRLVELVSLLVLLTAACMVVFGDLPQITGEVHVLALIVLPFVMWAAIRFGVSGAALSILVVAAIATVETALGSGPFVLNGPFTNAVLLDVFFGVLSITGLALAAVCAERERAHRERERMVRKQLAMEAYLQNQKLLQESEQRLRVATQAGKMYAYEWDVATDAVARAGVVEAVLGPEEASGDTRREWLARVHPDDRERLDASVHERTPESPDSQVAYRILRPDGSVIWLERTAHALFDEHGKMTRMIGIVADITERKLAEEERFRHAAIVESSSDAIISENCDGIITSWNAGAQRIFEYSEAEAVGQPSTIIIPPELVVDQERILERLRAGERIEHYETVRLTKSGKRVDVSVTVSPIKDGSGKIVGFSKIDRDITERRLAEQAMADMSRQLVAVQEEERSRIARDLHDDINQRLALLAIETDTLKGNLPNSVDETSRRLTQIREGILEASAGVQSISHQLHSPQLEYLGLVAAIKIFCREYSARQSVEIDFIGDEIPKITSPEVSLGLFRIMQEAVSNAAKHSQVRHFQVKLACLSDQLHLTVSDQGSGFDAGTAIHKGGLGLISMRERARLMNGTLAIDSNLMGGTTINVQVPVKPEQGFRQAAG